MVNQKYRSGYLDFKRIKKDKLPIKANCPFFIVLFPQLDFMAAVVLTNNYYLPTN
jgi:hypothetical protein